MLDFRILGPLEGLDDDRRVELGGARQRAVLAILVLHRGEAVSVDRIVDPIWGERPGTAVKTLQVYVSHLRRALAGRHFELARRIRPRGRRRALDARALSGSWPRGAARSPTTTRRASPSCASALAIRRGPALGDFAYEGFAQDQIARLEEVRLGAVEERIDAELGLGHTRVVPELNAVVPEHPLRERAACQHMLALYRWGRQADALERYPAPGARCSRNSAWSLVASWWSSRPRFSLRTLHSTHPGDRHERLGGEGGPRRGVGGSG